MKISVTMKCILVAFLNESLPSRDTSQCFIEHGPDSPQRLGMLFWPIMFIIVASEDLSAAFYIFTFAVLAVAFYL